MSDKTKPTPLPSWPGYAVTPCGAVYSLWSNWRGYGQRQLSQTVNASGYPSVRLIGPDGVRRHIAVHRLVADAFLPVKPSDQHEIRHLDGNKHNPCKNNLAWGTRAENARDRVAHGAHVCPQWVDPNYREKHSRIMRDAYAKRRAEGSGRYAK